MGPTIQGTLQAVLEQILQQPTPLQAASRTDAGVHATGQVVNFFITKEISLRSINALLPPDIRMLSLEEVPINFHPTLDAKSKEYHYQLCLAEVQLPHERRTAWHCPHLNVPAMEEALAHLNGTHDFAAFTNATKEQRENRVRTLHISFEDNLKVILIGDAFLFRMARNIVGTLVQVGQGKLSPDEIPLILQQGDRSLAGVCAPPCGLSLAKVLYG